MSKLPKLITVSDLRQDVAAVLKKLHASREPFVITERGRASAMLVSAETYERQEHEREILLLLARGEKEMATGPAPSRSGALRLGVAPCATPSRRR